MNRLPSHRAAPDHARHQRHRAPALRALAHGSRPPRWQRWAVHGATLALTLTGVGWLIAHHLLQDRGSFGEALPSPLEPWALRLHGMLAYAFLLVLGSMSTVHVVLGWRLRRTRRSGVGLIAAGLVLTVSGLALYYAPEPWHESTSLLHWATGLGLLPLLGVHVLAARRWRRRAARLSSA